MESVDDLLGWNTDGRDEQSSLLLDDDIDELIELTASVVLVGLSCSSTDLGQEKVDAERSRLVVQAVLELLDLGPKELGSVSDACRVAR